MATKKVNASGVGETEREAFAETAKRIMTFLQGIDWSASSHDWKIARIVDILQARSAGDAPPPRESEERILRGKEFQNPATRVMFRAGLLACREYMARFVEAESPSIAASIRANWWPELGDDPGVPRRLSFHEVADGGEDGPWTEKQISASIEALPEAWAFLQAAPPVVDSGAIPAEEEK